MREFIERDGEEHEERHCLVRGYQNYEQVIGTTLNEWLSDIF